MKKIATTEIYEDGQHIIKQGSFGEGTYVILSGKVAINVKDNGVDLTVTHLAAGDIFGHMSFIDRQPRSASAVAVGTVKVGLFDKDYLDTEINKTSEDFRIILKALTERLRDTTSKLVNLTIKYYRLTGETE
ncbi:MAG: cyclic nucleotide-binding domain-containing protein [Nitrospirae bacterium]|uniref:Crp/Fnr family transcriptional regulator n=1 Tax=Candidatus Magnetobacterium casense TaxID=1455061 RepID=UPI000697EC44|nr:cyclic nucleotide-binding domain-containing protein [Candidatus Magnetobacterium casensis]MBF0336503.1 cyclic nucleotide-binding domain-containing protein [Nitrospirota bacterium]